MNDSSPAANDLVQVRTGGTVLQMDVPTLITLIQRDAVDRESEVKSAKLTQGEWQKLGELELYRVLRPKVCPRPDVASTQTSVTWEPSELYEQNLKDYFGSPSAQRLRVDAIVAVASAAMVAVLTVVVHRFILILVLMAGVWVLSYAITYQVLFPGWIRGIRYAGFRRLPWRSRHFLVVAIVVASYFTIASFLPALPGEGLFRLIDGVVGILFTAAAATIWTFSLETRRAKRVFELSSAVSAMETGTGNGKQEAGHSRQNAGKADGPASPRQEARGV